MNSDESEDDGAGESREEMTYRRKYQMLLERCEVLQQDNERLVHRIQQVYKYTRQVRKERKFLMDRLDNHGDNWRLGISQFFFNDPTQYSKSSSKLKVKVKVKLKHHSSSSDKHTKKLSNISTKKSSKEKSDPDSVARKPVKEAINKNSSKNLPGYNFM